MDEAGCEECMWKLLHMPIPYSFLVTALCVLYDSLGSRNFCMLNHVTEVRNIQTLQLHLKGSVSFSYGRETNEMRFIRSVYVVNLIKKKQFLYRL